MRKVGNSSAKLPIITVSVDFKNVYFIEAICMGGFSFERGVEFGDAHFACSVDFNFTSFNAPNSIFSNLSFGGAHFAGAAFFLHAHFKESVAFGKAYFAGGAFFADAQFDKYISFSDTRFSGADFSGSNFGGAALFRKSHITGNAKFYDTHFAGDADFSGAHFRRTSDFSSAKFKSTTRFDDAKFYTQVPQFHAAELYDDTTFTLPDNPTENWPPLTGSVKLPDKDKPAKVMPAAEQKRAYNRLRLFMNKSLQIDEEQWFHRMEMRCKTALSDRWHKPIFRLYQYASDFGISVVRPVVGLLFVIFCGALAIYFYGQVDLCAATGWSISNSLPFLGFGRLHFGADSTGEPSTALNIIGGVQTLLGYVLLFFLGLGLRNRFRLR